MEACSVREAGISGTPARGPVMWAAAERPKAPRHQSESAAR
jgi:hypothetical protein